MSSQYHGGGFGPWRCGSGRRVLTAGVGRAGPAVFGGCSFRVLGLAALSVECRYLLDLERMLVAMVAAGSFDPCLVTFGDSSPTFINASNLFSRCIWGCRIPVYKSCHSRIWGRGCNGSNTRYS